MGGRRLGLIISAYNEVTGCNEPAVLIQRQDKELLACSMELAD